MPLDERDIAALEDMLRFANDGIGFVGDQDEAAFMCDRKTQQATMYAIATIAEASQRIGERLKSEHPEIPWPLIRGMRNIMLHEYGNVDMQAVYGVATRELPRLIAQVQAILDMHSA